MQGRDASWDNAHPHSSWSVLTATDPHDRNGVLPLMPPAITDADKCLSAAYTMLA